MRNTLIQNDQQCSPISPRCEPVKQNRNSHQNCIESCGTGRVGRLLAAARYIATDVPRSQGSAEPGRNATSKGKHSMPVAACLARYEADRMYCGSLNQGCFSIPFKRESGASRSGHMSLHLLVRFQLDLELGTKFRLSQHGAGFSPACSYDDRSCIKGNCTVGRNNQRNSQR